MSYDRALNQTINYLQKQKKRGAITHWELEMGDNSKRIFSVRVSKSKDGAPLFGAHVSTYHHGRDLLSAAHRAVAEVTA